MQISVEPREDYAILHLRGEFDTYYVPALQQEIDQLGKSGIHKAVLNLRLVRFINPTALGAVIKSSKQLAQKGGKLVISRPSTFCRDIFEKVGLDRVVPVFDSDEAATAALKQGGNARAQAAEDSQDNPSSVLFTPLDTARVEHFLSQSQRTVNVPITKEKVQAWSGAGRASRRDSTCLAICDQARRSSAIPRARLPQRRRVSGDIAARRSASVQATRSPPGTIRPEPSGSTRKRRIGLSEQSTGRPQAMAFGVCWPRTESSRPGTSKSVLRTISPP